MIFATKIPSVQESIENTTALFYYYLLCIQTSLTITTTNPSAHINRQIYPQVSFPYGTSQVPSITNRVKG